MCSTPRPVSRKPARKTSAPGYAGLNSRAQRRYAILANQAEARRQRLQKQDEPPSPPGEDPL